ncbi:hypothetical protein B0A52_02678 [Exophiala mesophila]|uniref:UBC core domain-containing protein n=1 Tax=Exophiala mesophila TaxID=212818 RepID=A0A438NDM0_EXOME|nr:hypothetical protein B0A52_02678 [Exophiala mesophila]
MRTLELYDHVQLKTDPALRGTIERTHTESFEPLADELIIAHVPVPPEILNQFVTTGAPPSGYVFVQFEDEPDGSSLVAEDDLILISRSFQIGDHVRLESKPITGTVVSIDESYILQPILSLPFTIPSKGLFPQQFDTCTSECINSLPAHLSPSNPHVLLVDVPAREVKRVQDVMKDDFILSKNWVGTVEEVQYNIVILLADHSLVQIPSLDGLYIPVRAEGKPLIALPEEDGFRPDVVGALQGWSTTIPVYHVPRPGSFVIVDGTRLRQGKWIKGGYSSQSPAHGWIVNIRAGEVTVDWVGSKESPSGMRTSGDDMPPYELEFFDKAGDPSRPDTLCPRTDVVIYDTGISPVNGNHENVHGPPGAAELGGENQGAHHDSMVSPRSGSGQDLGAGTHVRFRDPTAARVKYQGVGTSAHGAIQKVNKIYGWDMDEYRIVHVTQTATVLWQDGSVSNNDSSTLHGFSLFEPDISPADFVLKRDGMQQRDLVMGEVKTFNEMTFFEEPHDLLPRSVGVVQTVDSAERIARVRWFKEPQIELRSNGSVLAPHSRYGAIGDVVEDISLYEIMSFLCLQRKPKNLCVINRSRDGAAKIADDDTVPVASREVSRSIGRYSNHSSRRSRRGSVPDHNGHISTMGSARAKRPDIDWYGEIVATNLDGSCTVRLGAAQKCRDVCVVPDDILAVIDEQEHLGDYDNESMDLDEASSDWSVEYEGGERMDADSGDDNWESEGEDDEDEDEILFTLMQERKEDVDEVEMKDTDSHGDDTQRPSLARLTTALQHDAPHQFRILESDPPQDQFGRLSLRQSPGSFLKRILKEHRALSMGLPEGEIYVRTYESRLDLLRCLIIGPRDTPYESAPFLIDLQLPEGFPEAPPVAHFHSWTSGLGRINPNLYEEGKICLSLLGTWTGKHESEKWSDKATILQLLVSLQGLVMVRRPFFNEAGFEGFEHDIKYTVESELYSEKAYLMARRFVKHALTQPPSGLEDVIAFRYLSKDGNGHSLLETVIERGRQLIQASENARQEKDTRLMDASGSKEDPTQVFLKPLSRGASVMLGRVLSELEAQLDRWQPSTRVSEV